MDGGAFFPYGNALAFPLTLVLGVVVGLIDAGSEMRRRVAVLVASASVVPPFFVEPEHTAWRLLTAMATVMVVLRALDLSIERRAWPWWRRAWLMVSIWDSRRAGFEAPGIDGRAWLRVVAFSALAVPLGIGVAVVSSLPSPWWALGLRWLLGAAFTYVVFDALHAAMIAIHRLFGVVVPPFHRDPVRSRSLNEFWGARWNLIIHDALSRHLFRPLARRRHPWLGVAATFAASALIHAWLMAAALGMEAALGMGSYFLIQGLALALERPLGVAGWRSGLRRAWTVLAVVGPSPLFIEPLLTTLGF